MSRSTPLPSRRASRRGVVVAMALVVLAVLLALAGVWARRALAESRRGRLEEEHAQAVWLAEAGVRRGAARRLADPDFAGETWTVAAGELARPHPAQVDLRLEPVENRPEQIRIIAQSSYPRDNPRVRVSKQVVFNLPSTGE